MAFTGTTYAEVAAGLTDVENRLASQTRTLENGLAVPGNVKGAMTIIGNDYTGLPAAAQALLDADPTNAELVAMRSRTNLLLSDRATLSDRAGTAETAVAGI